jgi:acyl carrier protein phosphodiesterase
MTQPIKPSEITKAKQAAIPDEVIETFNELVAEKWDGSSATVRQTDAVKAILAKRKPAIDRLREQDLYDRHWLDVEDIFRAVGWKVEYDKPGYNETYEATFTFRKKGR